MNNKIIRNMLIPGVVALLVLLVPGILIQYRIINGYFAQIVSLAAVNAIMAISVNMICGITGQLSLGQAGFEALGAYAAILLTVNCHLPLVVSIMLSGIIAAFFGFLIGFPTLKLEGDYLAIVTLAFGEIIRVVLVNLKTITGGPNGKQFSTVLTASLDYGALISYVAIIGSLVLIIVLLQNFLRSTYGRAILAGREDEIAANSNGVGVFKYKMIGFVIGSLVAGLGGALYAPFIGFIKAELATFSIRTYGTAGNVALLEGLPLAHLSGDLDFRDVVPTARFAWHKRVELCKNMGRHSWLLQESCCKV